MLENLLIVAQQVGVLFLLMAVGFFLGKRRLLDEHTVFQMSTLLLYVITPCVVLNSLQVEYSAHLASALLWGFAFLAAQYAVLILLSQCTFRHAPPEQRGPLRFAQVYSNNVFMGLPLIQAVLGSAGAIFVVPSLIAFQISMWTHGVLVMGGKVSPKKVLYTPAILASILGFALFFAQIPLPPVVGQAVSFLADVNTPLAMVIIGLQMSWGDLKRTFTNRQLYGVTAIRLLLSPLVTLAIMFPFRSFDPNLFSAFVILSAAPVGGATSIFAQRFEQDTVTAAQAVSLSTLLSLLTLPVFAVAAKTIVGL